MSYKNQCYFISVQVKKIRKLTAVFSPLHVSGTQGISAPVSSALPRSQPQHRAESPHSS